MKKLLIFVYSFGIAFAAFSQKNLPVYGEIDIADLKMISCSFEPDAPAMKLFDVQETEYEPSVFGEKIRTERRVRIKIFNEKGYPFANIRIPYLSKKKNDQVTKLTGIVYTLDGSGKIMKQQLEEDDFYKDKIQERVGLITFTFPALKPGSVIEYSYTKIEKTALEFDPWLIQDEIPVAYASIDVITPNFSRIREAVFGIDTVIQRKTESFRKGGYERNKHIYYKENIQSFKPERFMSSTIDNLLKIVYILFKGNSPVTDALYESPMGVWRYAGAILLKSTFFGGQMEKPIPGTEKIIDSASTILYIEDRINFIYKAVKKRMHVKTIQTMIPNDIAEAWKNGVGNTAEINLILINLFKKTDIQCYPVLISTRDNGKINTDFAGFGQLNGVDVFVKDKDSYYFLDASLKYQSYLVPPLNILNRHAFLLEPMNIRWIQITDDRPLSKESADIFASFNENGSLEGTATLQYYDYSKSFVLDSTISGDNKDNKFFDKMIPGLTILSDKQENADNDNEPLFQTIEFKYDPQQSGDFYFINPQLLSSKNQNPFVQDKRNTDIDFGCNREVRVTMQLEMPKSFEVEHLPSNITVRTPDSSFFFRRIISADSLNISFFQTFEIKKAIFDKQEYAGVFEFFSQVYKLMGEEIILKKKK